MPIILSSKRALKRKHSKPGGEKASKKQKLVVESVQNLPWKTVPRLGESGFDDDDGILELEEVEGVEVVYEETGAGKVVKFKVQEQNEDLEDDIEDDTSSEQNEAEERTEDDVFDASQLLPDWAEFDLHPFLGRSLLHNKFKTPTPIQRSTLPAALKGKDIVGVAETGSGKTLAYGIPILQHLLSNPYRSNSSSSSSKKGLGRRLKALVLTPTRELALQVATHLRECALDAQDDPDSGSIKEEDKAAPVKRRNPRVSIAAVVGGMSVHKQRRVIDRGVDIIVATPGRLWDLLQEDDSLATQVKDLKFLVLDEADRMIEIGHFAELENIVRLTLRPETDESVQQNPPLEEGRAGNGEEEAQEEDDKAPSNNDENQLQTFVFSATLSRDLQQNLKKPKRSKNFSSKQRGNTKPATTLDELLLKLDFRDPDPEIIDLSPVGGAVSTLKESRIESVMSDKDAYLYYFLLRYPGRSLVFLSAIDGIRRLLPLLELLQVKAFPLHSQLQQRQRLKNLDRFKSIPNSVLLATDIAARGLDIASVDHVIHYQVPRTADAYIHRNGRTARASRDGFSLLMCAPDEKRVVRALMTSLGRVDENEIPEMPVELDLLDKLKGRIQLAKRIDSSQHTLKKQKHEKNWLREAAEAMEIDMDSDLEESDDAVSAKKSSKDAQKTVAMKAELKKLLSKPLIATGAYKTYLTSGSRDIVGDLLKSEGSVGLFGFTRKDAKEDLLNGKKSKGRPKVKKAAKEHDPLKMEWTGFD